MPNDPVVERYYRTIDDLKGMNERLTALLRNEEPGLGTWSYAVKEQIRQMAAAVNLVPR